MSQSHIFTSFFIINITKAVYHKHMIFLDSKYIDFFVFNLQVPHVKIKDIMMKDKLKLISLTFCINIYHEKKIYVNALQ